MDSDNLGYQIGFWITAVITFIISWASCTIIYGFLGFVVGWFPSVILAAIAGFLWPLIILIAFGLWIYIDKNKMF